jgi:hypothetical protein
MFPPIPAIPVARHYRDKYMQTVLSVINCKWHMTSFQVEEKGALPSNF